MWVRCIAVMLQGFLLVGLERASAMTMTLLLHGVSYMATTVPGALFFSFKGGMNFKDITTKPAPAARKKVF